MEIIFSPTGKPVIVIDEKRSLIFSTPTLKPENGYNYLCFSGWEDVVLVTKKSSGQAPTGNVKNQAIGFLINIDFSELKKEEEDAIGRKYVETLKQLLGKYLVNGKIYPDKISAIQAELAHVVIVEEVQETKRKRRTKAEMQAAKRAKELKKKAKERAKADKLAEKIRKKEEQKEKKKRERKKWKL